MKVLPRLLVILAIASGCVMLATASARAQAGGTLFRGEVWTWDEADKTVTLRQGEQDIRVKVTPDQLIGLRLHDIVTLRGELMPPKEIATVIEPAQPVVFIPTGPGAETVLTGRIAAVDPQGKIAVESDRGQAQVWVASPSGYRVGDNVHVTMTVRNVQVVSGATAVSAPTQPTATGSGDFALVVGRVAGREASGLLTVESPRGPVQVVVAQLELERYRVGDWVQVRSRVMKP